MDAVLRLFARRETILLTFVVATICTAIGGIAEGVTDAWFTGIGSVVVFGLLAWFTHQRQLLATWCTVLVLIVVGSGHLYDSFLALTGPEVTSFPMLILKGVVGIYLTWGALLIHRERHIRD